MKHKNTTIEIDDNSLIVPRYGNALMLMFEFFSETGLPFFIHTKIIDDDFFKITFNHLDVQIYNVDDVFNYINLNIQP